MTAVQIGLAIAAGTLAVAALQLGVALLNERRRTQPIVIAHEVERRSFSPDGSGWRVLSRITNEGAGPAFNVRFGVSYFGVRFAYRLSGEDPTSGSRQRVVQPGCTIPPSGAWSIEVPSEELWAGEGVPEKGEHFYWARYSNAQGKTWETRNPPDRTANLDIRRVRLVRIQEWFEGVRHGRLLKRSRKVERQMMEELRQGPESDSQRG